MFIRKILKFIAEDLFSIFGFILVRTSDHRNRSVMENSIKFLSKNTEINTIIDIGASDGRWSLNAKKSFKNSNFHLIEANQQHEKSIKKITERLNNASYSLKVAGNYVGDIFFNDSDLYGGSTSTIYKEDYKRMESTTVDFDVQNNKLKGPFLIKFDTHGFEKEILLGSEKTLENTSAIIMECYNFQLTNNSLCFWEMCEFLGKRNFRVADVVNQLYRPQDNFLWQMDILFLKSDRIEFTINSYNKT